jgi:hypothetical protein
MSRCTLGTRKAVGGQRYRCAAVVQISSCNTDNLTRVVTQMTKTRHTVGLLVSPTPFFLDSCSLLSQRRRLEGSLELIGAHPCAAARSRFQICTEAYCQISMAYQNLLVHVRARVQDILASVGQFPDYESSVTPFRHRSAVDDKRCWPFSVAIITGRINLILQ